MKTLHIMRHAKSDWAAGATTDHARPINDRGRRQAAEQAALFEDTKLDAVVSSDATRAVQTAAYILRVCDDAESIQTPDLYHASVADWCDVCAGFPDEWTEVLAVAHNPGIGELLLRLGGDGHVPTATILTVRLASWDALLDGELVEVAKP